MWFVTRVFFKNGTQSNSIQMFTDELAARKRFYTILATDIDNKDIEFELIQIVREDGVCIASMPIDNREA